MPGLLTGIIGIHGVISNGPRNFETYTSQSNEHAHSNLTAKLLVLSVLYGTYLLSKRWNTSTTNTLITFHFLYSDVGKSSIY